MDQKYFTNTLKYSDWRYQIMDLRGDALQNEIDTLSRNDIIDWLQRNDPNGIYTDKQSIKELGFVMSREEGIEIMTRHIEEQHLLV